MGLYYYILSEPDEAWFGAILVSSEKETLDLNRTAVTSHGNKDRQFETIARLRLG